MILNYMQIKDVTLGALDVVREENGDISFKRLTDKQLECYRTHNEAHYHRAHDTAGVRLSFYTDASSVKIDYEMKRGIRPVFFHIDVVCDGAIIEHTRVAAEGNQCEGTLIASLPEGKHLVTVHLPNKSMLILRSFELENAEIFEPYTPKGPKILFLGDSITHGAFTSYPSLTYTARLTAMTDAIAINQGIGADVFRPDIIDPEIPFDPDVITIAFGTNDWSSARNNPDLRNSHANDYFDNVKKAFPRAKIVYISPIWRKLTDEENVSFMEARRQFEEIARSKEISVIDGFTLVPHLSEFYWDKNLHPNDLGFSLYAENLAVALKKLGIV